MWHSEIMNTQLTDVYAMYIHILETRDTYSLLWKTEWAAHWSWAQSGCRSALFRIMAYFEPVENLEEVPGHWLNEWMLLDTHCCWKVSSLPTLAFIFPWQWLRHSLHPFKTQLLPKGEDGASPSLLCACPKSPVCSPATALPLCMPFHGQIQDFPGVCSATWFISIVQKKTTRRKTNQNKKTHCHHSYPIPHSHKH